MNKSTTRQTLSIYWRYTMRYKPAFLIGAIGAALAIVAQGLAAPFVVSRVFSKLQTAYQHHQALQLHSFIPYFVWFAVAMVMGVILWRVQAFFVWRFEENVQHDIANDIYDHLQMQSQQFHADRFSGALVSQTNKFISAYERLMDDLIWSIIPIVTSITVATAVLLFVSIPYALVILGFTIIYLLLMTFRIRKQLPFNSRAAKTESDQTAALADAITNLPTIRAFAGESYESKRFQQASGIRKEAYRLLSIEVFKTEALSHIQTNGFQVLSLFAGLVAITTYHTNVSLLYLLVSYTQNIVNQLYLFSRVVRNTNRGLGDAVEMTEILGIEPEIKDVEKAKRLIAPHGKVSFEGVEFSYAENIRAPLFKDFNLRIQPGEKVGLVGPSGGGKTSITKLLLRFMDIEKGTIKIDGQDIAQITQSDLRSHIAYVSQEPVLFHRSLAENIAYGDLSVPPKAIEAVAKLAHAHEFISALPQGYDTLVGERGVKLSGGQRQRVAIARAMLKNAPVLVLDEATSALDSENEALIQDALWKLMEGRTAIVIAHRLSTIQKMDRIVVLNNGAIAEQGSHKELLAHNGIYANLWARQSGGFMEE